jgi:two-component system, NarL family, nitrate/nitrite response regulator NarL
VPIRVILADDHGIVLNGLKRLFDSDGEFSVVACCRDGDEALQAVQSHDADVLVLDVEMPGRSGLEVLRELGRASSRCRIVLLTAAISDEDMAAAVHLGAQGLVLKESDPETLLDCVRRVHLGDRPIDGATAKKAVKRPARQPVRVLTPRETEIVQMVAHGLRNRIIGERLSISEGTVKIHLHNIYDKLGVDGRLELVLSAQQKGLV